MQILKASHFKRSDICLLIQGRITDYSNFRVINKVFGTHIVYVKNYEAFISEFGKEENPACKTDFDWIKNNSKSRLFKIPT
jgi:hypothetical protein